jgi:two-component system cell cycle sensor histidine kinase/response regulator CckA
MPSTERPVGAEAFPLEYVDVAAMVYGPDTAVIFANDSACCLLGLSRDEMLGKRLGDSLWSFFSEDGESLSTDEHPVARAVATAQPVWRSLIAAGRPQEGDRVWLLASAIPELDNGGGVRRVVLTLVDVTDGQTASADRAGLEERLIQAQRMESVGQLAGGIAHDFNNILMVMKGYCELTRLAVGENKPLLDGLEKIESQADRAIELTRQLLAFSKKQTLHPADIDLNNLFADMEPMLRTLVGEGIQVVVNPASHPATVTADRAQLEQALVNLAANARDSMPVGGKLTIDISWVDIDEGSTLSEHGVEPGSYVKVAVSDTGEGMDAETKRRVFEPFFKPKGEGSGLGLSTAYGIVHQSGGTINVDSAPGKGSTFTIYLPRVEFALARTGGAADRASAPGGRAVLVVEDEPALRGLVVMMLEKLGYDVFEAGNGGEALRLIQEEGLQPDLLLTDVVMPEMSGTVLVERLQGFMPGLKVMYMSGYADETILDHGIIGAGMEFLRKPFSMTDLEERVEALLGPSITG